MDPIAAQLTKTAAQGLEKQLPKNPAPKYQIEQSQFGQVLNNQLESGQDANGKLLNFVEELTQPNSGVKAIPAGEIHVDLAKAPEVTPTANSNKNAIFGIFKEINSSQNNMDKLMENLASGKKFSTHELIRLQIFSHQHAMGYEMFSRMGAEVNRSIQSVTNMQV